MKVKATDKWRSIPMPHNFFTSGEMNQAVCGGIEELTDYTLVVKGKKSGKVLKRKLSAKESSIDVRNEIPPKKSKKNVFNVSDLPKEENEDKKDDLFKANKKKKKKSKDKPAINLNFLNELSNNADDQSKRNSKNLETSDKKSLVVKKKSKASVSADNNNSENDQDLQPKSAHTSLNVDMDLSDMNQWKDLFVCDEILKALSESGFKSPTPIQKLTLPASLKGNMDIIGAAETGSGKTLAFGIPIIQGILADQRHEDLSCNDDIESNESEDIGEEEPHGIPFKAVDVVEEPHGIPGKAVDVVDNVHMDIEVADEDLPSSVKGDKLRALVLTPTRELAMQVHKHLVAAAKHTGIRIAVVVGGLSVEKQIRLLSRGPAIVVATPGRLWDLVQEGNPHFSNLGDLRYLAIDETDRMVEKGHFEELEKILEMIKSSPDKKNVRRQTFIMSATLSLVHKPPQHAKKQKQKSKNEKLGELMEAIGVRDRRKVVDITRKVGTAETLSESVIHCPLTDKDFYLYYLIKTHPGRTVVFCNSIDCVRRLANLFSLLDVIPLPLHAQLHQKQRLKNLDRFAASNTGLLIATDVAARGLDIPNIEHVIHYQVPRTSESYVHRSGRTARSSKQGFSLLLVEPGEQGQLKKLCQTLSKDGDHSLPVFPIDQSRIGVVKERVGLARKLDKLLLASRKKTVGDNWRSKAAEDADLYLSEDEDSEEEFYQGRLEGNGKNGVDAVKKELQVMLKTPFDHQVYGGAYPTMGGGMPADVLVKKEEKAVEVLKNNLKYTQKLLKSNKSDKKRKRFKGFKKRRTEKL